MKLSDIRIGEEYAVSVSPKQVDLEEGPRRGPGSLRREKALAETRRYMFGYRARVLGFESSKTGRSTVVRVELTAHRLRQDERWEDNYDGTRTHWLGVVYDEDGRVIEDEETFEAVIQPSQVALEWTEAVVRREVRDLDSEWRRMS